MIYSSRSTPGPSTGLTPLSERPSIVRDMALDQGTRRHLTDAALAVVVGALVMTAAAVDDGATPPTTR